MVDYEWYRSFIAVYRLGTVTSAAVERNLTQPAVSQHLAALEAAIGGQLFTRTPRQMVPTEQGKQLYTQVVQAIETLDQASQRLRNPLQGNDLLLRLGTPREYFAERALSQFQATKLRVWIQFGTTRSLVESLHRHELDAVIATERIFLRGIEYRKLATESFLLVGGAQHLPPLTQPTTAEQRRVLESWLIGQAWVSYGLDLPIIRRFWREAFASRPAIEPALIVPDLTLVARAVASGFGVSVLPDYLVAGALAAGQLTLIWQPMHPITNDLWLAYHTFERQRPEIEQACAALGLMVD